MGIKDLFKNKKEEPVPAFRSASEWNQDIAFQNPILEIPRLYEQERNFIILNTDRTIPFKSFQEAVEVKVLQDDGSWGTSGSYTNIDSNDYYGKALTMKRKLNDQIESITCEYCGQSFYLSVKEIKAPVFVLSCPFCGGRA